MRLSVDEQAVRVAPGDRAAIAERVALAEIVRVRREGTSRESRERPLGWRALVVDAVEVRRGQHVVMSSRAYRVVRVLGPYQGCLPELEGGVVVQTDEGRIVLSGVVEVIS